jgi:hypothetical protein
MSPQNHQNDRQTAGNNPQLATKRTGTLPRPRNAENRASAPPRANENGARNAFFARANSEKKRAREAESEEIRAIFASKSPIFVGNYGFLGVFIVIFGGLGIFWTGKVVFF